MSQKQLKVIHFVAGGFTGSTAVASDLVNATRDNDSIDSLLVLRKRPTTDMGRVEALAASGTPIKLISGGLKLYTIFQLYRICKKFNPDVLVAHGFTEHLWGRYAGVIAKVPVLIHVEHNTRENYSLSRRLQMRFLTRFTDAIVGCAEGVKARLKELGLPTAKLLVISNGIDLSRFKNATTHPFESRTPAIIMSSRFGRQKDHTTAIRAIGLLRDKGLNVNLTFAGTGHPRYMAMAQDLTRELLLDQHITFAGHCSNLPALLMQHQIFLLSSHYEGMPLALAEGMAAGCAAIGSRVPGIQEMLNDGQDSLVVEHQSPESLASAIEILVTNTAYARQLATAGRLRALSEFSLERMRDEYEMLYRSLADKKHTRSNR